MNHTKIVATIGPATSSKEVLRELFAAGINVCRLNFSHGTHDDHRQSIQNIIELNEEMCTNVTILADLQGPKLRIGELESETVVLENGQMIDLVTDECLGTREMLNITFKDFAKDVKQGDAVLIDDGKVKQSSFLV